MYTQVCVLVYCSVEFMGPDAKYGPVFLHDFAPRVGHHSSRLLSSDIEPNYFLPWSRGYCALLTQLVPFSCQVPPVTMRLPLDPVNKEPDVSEYFLPHYPIVSMDDLLSTHYSESVSEPELHELKSSAFQFKSLKELFVQRWRQPRETLPAISRIFEIRYNQTDMARYERYRAWVGAHTETLEFHGTDRACMLGEHKNPRCRTALCSLNTCLLCSVLRHSFRVSACGTKNKFKRFGHGIYTSPVSSKAHGYVQNTQTFSATSSRLMLVVRVVRGRSWVTRDDAKDLKCPPPGYDSVYGIPGGSLKYSETVLYSDDAIRPVYLILYTPPLDVQNSGSEIDGARGFLSLCNADRDRFRPSDASLRPTTSDNCSGSDHSE